MNKEVGVSPDGRGKVPVIFLGETVMAQWVGSVAGPGEGAQEANPQSWSSRGFVQSFHESLEFLPVVQVAAGNTVKSQGVPEFLKASGVGVFMDTMKSRALQLSQPGGDGFIGEEHEFLDELMGPVVGDLLDRCDTPLSIKTKECFGGRELQGAGSEAARPELPGKLICVLDHAIKPVSGLAGDNGHSLLIGVATSRADNCRREAGS